MGHTSSWFDSSLPVCPFRCEWFAWPPPKDNICCWELWHPLEEEGRPLAAWGCLPALFSALNLRQHHKETQQQQQQQKTVEGRKMLFLVEVGRGSPIQQRWGFVIDCCPLCRLFLLEEEREEDWAKPVHFPLCGTCICILAAQALSSADPAPV